MTTKERQTMQNFINKLTTFRKIQDEMLNNLMELNATYGDGSRYCSWKYNLDKILENCTDSTIRARAETMYENYLKASAKEDLIRDLGCELAELNFWKKG